MSDFIPNSFQVPNAYVDRFWHLLTPPEQSVLIYLVRRIFGFGKRQDRVALSQIMSGITTNDGKRLDYGTGLGYEAVRRALNGLLRAGFVAEVEPAVPRRRLAACYELQTQAAQIDVEWLENRAQQQRDGNVNRTAPARMEQIAGRYFDNVPDDEV